MTQSSTSIAPDVQYWTKSLIYLFGIGSIAYIVLPAVYERIDYWNPVSLILPTGRRSTKMNVLRRKKKTGKYTVGLTNRANDCFANSNIQALASVPLLVDYLRELCNGRGLSGITEESVVCISPTSNAYIKSNNVKEGNKEGGIEPRKSATDSTVRSNGTSSTMNGNGVGDDVDGVTNGDTNGASNGVNSNSNSQVDAPPDSTTATTATATTATATTATTATATTATATTATATTATATTITTPPTSTNTPPIPLLSIALLQMIKELNEPILAPKTMSPWTFLVVLEKIYKSRISRNQHDAHELLHLILETLQNEYEAIVKLSAPPPIPKAFAFAGSTIDRITCSKCGYSPPATPSAFVVLSLMVPQKRSAALADLLNGLSSPEYIQDYGCEHCRLKHACLMKNGEEFKKYLQNPSSLPPELEAKLPKDIVSPIAKSTKFHKLPTVLAIHLSRSIYGGYGASRNSCKVSTKEYIELVEQETNELVKYRLMAMIRHKGTHQMGHYECFRRKNLMIWKDILKMLEREEKERELEREEKARQREEKEKEEREREEGKEENEKEKEQEHQHEQHQTEVKEEEKEKANSIEIVPNEAIDKNNTENIIEDKQDINSISITPTIITSPSSPTTTPSITTITTDTTFNTTPSSSLTTGTSTHSPVPSLSSDNHTSSSSSSSSLSNVSATSTSAIPLPYPSDRSMPSPASLSTTEFASAEISINPLRAVENLLPSSHSPTTTTINNNNNIRNEPNNISPPSHHEWWKISDDKIWECTTKEVLREESGAYLLFYERIIQ